MNTVVLKFLAGVGLFGLWAALVFLGKSDASSLITAVSAALAGLGIYSASGGQKGEKGDPGVPGPAGESVPPIEATQVLNEENKTPQ